MIALALLADIVVRVHKGHDGTMAVPTERMEMSNNGEANVMKLNEQIDIEMASESASAPLAQWEQELLSAEEEASSSAETNSDQLAEVLEDEKGNVTQTVRDFFENLPLYTYVGIGRIGARRRRFIFAGWSYADNGEVTGVLLVNENFGTIARIDQADLALGNRWDYVKTGPNHSGVIAEATTQAIVKSLLSFDRRLEATHKSLADKVAEVREMRQDVDLLNEKLNFYAVDRGWCREYETIIGEWNKDFQRLQLIGRPMTYWVRVLLGNNEVRIPKVAQSLEEAENEVRNMNPHDFLQLLLEEGNGIGSMKFELRSDRDKQEPTEPDPF